MIVVLMRSVGVPGEGIGIIMGVDRILDMCRTVLNVTGDLVVATCVAGGPEARPSVPGSGQGGGSATGVADVTGRPRSTSPAEE